MSLSNRANIQGPKTVLKNQLSAGIHSAVLSTAAERVIPQCKFTASISSNNLPECKSRRSGKTCNRAFGVRRRHSYRVKERTLELFEP